MPGAQGVKGPLGKFLFLKLLLIFLDVKSLNNYKQYDQEMQRDYSDV